MIDRQEISIHHYELFSRTDRLNAKSDRKGFCGALVRVNGYRGAGCIHSWPELGDEPLDVQLEKLRRGETTDLTAQALACATSNWDSWFADGSVPSSHCTIVDSQASEPAAVRDAGFNSVKLKLDGRNLEQTAQEIARWSDAGLRLRIDFNETASVEGMLDLWKSLSNQSAIEFIEDPVPWDSSAWQKLKAAGIPLAADRGLEIPGKAEIADWWVVKSALLDPQKMADRAASSGKKLIITTYMDHAVGQLWAMQWAAALGLQLDCGLLTHELFQPDSFFESIKTKGPRVLNAADLPDRFCELLDQLDWTPL